MTRHLITITITKHLSDAPVLRSQSNDNISFSFHPWNLQGSLQHQVQLQPLISAKLHFLIFNTKCLFFITTNQPTWAGNANIWTPKLYMFSLTQWHSHKLKEQQLFVLWVLNDIALSVKLDASENISIWNLETLPTQSLTGVGARRWYCI